MLNPVLISCTQSVKYPPGVDKPTVNNLFSPPDDMIFKNFYLDTRNHNIVGGLD